jgi:CMP/dCMP kinase
MHYNIGTARISGHWTQELSALELLEVTVTTITISRKLGSLGNQIAEQLGEALGYQVASRKVINEAAGRSGEPEVALAYIDDLKLLDLRPSYRARRAYHEAVREILEELAAEGQVIIVGRAGQSILGGRPDVLHVRVTAPEALRIDRVALKEGISAAAARARVESSDKSRRKYLRRNYHVDWDDPELYDLVINTAHLTAEVAATLILTALPGSPPPQLDDARVPETARQNTAPQ